MTSFILFLVFSGGVFWVDDAWGKSVREPRRWFGYTYTETKIQTDVVTSLVPSSCVQVEPSLPPCRGVRNLDPFPEFVGTQIYPERIRGRQLLQPPSNPQKPSQILLAPVNTTRTVGWAEYLGFVAPTVTVTAIQLQTATVLDPRTVVTFSVKGCRPSRLPMDLDRCATPSGLSIEEILPTPTAINPVIKPTARSESSFNHDLHGNELHAKRSKFIQIEPSTLDLIDDSSSNVPTKDLSDVSLIKK